MQSPRGLARELSPVLERLVRLVRQLATTGGLSVPAASLLARLVREGPQRLTGLAGHEGISQPAMTQLVGRLERDGLVRREPDTEDRRAVVVAVTAAGRHLLDRRRAERAAALHRLLDQLEPTHARALHDALPALAALINLAEQPPSPIRPTRTAGAAQ